MAHFETQEQRDGTHLVIKGRVGLYGPDKIIPRDVVKQLIDGDVAEMEEGMTMRPSHRAIGCEA